MPKIPCLSTVAWSYLLSCSRPEASSEVSVSVPRLTTMMQKVGMQRKLSSARSSATIAAQPFLLADSSSCFGGSTSNSKLHDGHLKQHFHVVVSKLLNIPPIAVNAPSECRRPRRCMLQCIQQAGRRSAIQAYFPTLCWQRCRLSSCVRQHPPHALRGILLRHPAPILMPCYTQIAKLRAQTGVETS